MLASPDLPDLVHQIAADLQIDSLNEKIAEHRVAALETRPDMGQLQRVLITGAMSG